MNANDCSNNVEVYDNVSTIVQHPKTMDNGVMITAATNATVISFLWPSAADQPSRIQASLV